MVRDGNGFCGEKDMTGQNKQLHTLSSSYPKQMTPNFMIVLTIFSTNNLTSNNQMHGKYCVTLTGMPSNNRKNKQNHAKFQLI